VRPLTDYDLDPNRKLWTCWHEAANIIAVYAVGGQVQEVTLRIHEVGDHELNMIVAWHVDSDLDSPIVCAAGPVVDDEVGPTITNDIEEIEFHASQDIAELARLMRERKGRTPTDREVRQEVERGRHTAQRLLRQPKTDALVRSVRDYLYLSNYHGAHKRLGSEIEAHMAKFFSIPLASVCPPLSALLHRHLAWVKA
jgi:hypothetical protein